MRIGIFDSGLGGLFVLKSIAKNLPEYDYVYLGDTLHLPYGDRSPEKIYELLETGVEYLFKNDCMLIIVACNTASAKALRQIQQEYLPKHYPDRRVLGVIIPAIEESLDAKRVGVLGTMATVDSRTYVKEFKKANAKIRVFQQAAPLLVPFIENGEWDLLTPVLVEYLKPLVSKDIDTLILGCTHYPLIKGQVKKIVGKKIRVVCQDEFIHKKLKDYLSRHPEIEKKLSKHKARKFLITEKTDHFEKIAKRWFGKSVKLEEVRL